MDKKTSFARRQTRENQVGDQCCCAVNTFGENSQLLRFALN
jgi:hypothetical protein